MQSRNEFDSLYDQLATAWDSHQNLKLSNAPVAALADSSARLFRAQMAMWDWHNNNMKVG